MTTLPLHSALVHVPLGLAVTLPVLAIALLLLAFRRRADAPSRAPLLLLAVAQAVLFGSGLLVAQLGERDAERVERVTGEAAIEAHEERAEAFVATAGVVLAIAAGALVLPRRTHRAGLAAVAAGSIAVAGLAIWTGSAGGALVYAHGGAAAWRTGAPGAPGAPAVPAVADRDEDD